MHGKNLIIFDYQKMKFKNFLQYVGGKLHGIAFDIRGDNDLFTYATYSNGKCQGLYLDGGYYESHGVVFDLEYYINHSRVYRTKLVMNLIDLQKYIGLLQTAPLNFEKEFYKEYGHIVVNYRQLHN